MAITIDYTTFIVHVPRTDLTLVQSVPTEIRSMDLNWFRLEVKAIEDTALGMPYPDVTSHNTEVSLGGLTYARTIEILDPYTVTFEDGQYAVDLPGANSNLADKTNVNQVSVRPQNSAGMISSPDIEYAAFNGGISYDDVNGYPGTGQVSSGANIGTPRAPSNNVYDSRTIAMYRGFTTGYIINDMNIPVYELDGFTPFEMYGFTFQGSGKDRTNINIPEDALVYSCTYLASHITGYLDGDNTLIDCLIDNLYYIKGFIEQCVLAPGTIVLGGSDTAHFLDCYSGVPGTGTPTIDMGGSGQPLALRNYNGGIKLINKDGPESVSIDLNSGQVKLDMVTVTNGVIVVRGVGKLIDSTTGNHIHSGTYGDLEIINELVSTVTTAATMLNYPLTNHTTPGTVGAALHDISYTDKFVFINTELGTNGDGKSNSPFNNVSDAVDFAESVGWRKLIFLADATLERTLKNFTVEGIGLPTIDLNGQNVDKSEFLKVKLSGTQVGEITAREVVLMNGLSGVNGVYKESGLAGNITCADNCIVTIASISSLFVSGIIANSIDMGAGNTSVIVNARKISGFLLLQNCNTVTKVATLEFSGGRCELDNSNTSGTIGVAGIPFSALQDDSNGSNVLTVGMLPSAATVWEYERV